MCSAKIQSSFGQEIDPIERIPFELKGEYVIFKLTLNNSDTLNCLFDTGATSGVMVLNDRVAKDMNLASGKSVSATGGGGSVKDVKKIKGNTLKINDIVLKGIILYCIPLEHIELESGINIDGIVGDILLTRYVVKVDYDTGYIELYSKDEYQYLGNGIEIPIKKIPVLNLSYLTGIVEFDDGTSVKGKYLIDSGAAHSLIFSSPFSRKNDLKTKFSKLITYKTKGLSDDEIDMSTGRLKHFSVGELDFRSLPVSISNADKGVLSWKKFSGILGNKILRKYNITYDYKRNVTYWELNQYTDALIETNCAGFEVAYIDNSRTRIIVNQLSNDSPAQRAGIMIDDEVIAINMQDALKVGVLGIHQMLKEHGKEIEIQVKRDEEIITFLFHLRLII
jgi:hypothetical protein